MPSKRRARAARVNLLLIANLAVAALAPNLYRLTPVAWADPILVFVAVALLLILFERSYGPYLWFGASFMLYLVGQIILGSLAVARLVLHPHPKLDPGIIGIPLQIDSGIEITTLASAISLTPGTVSIDLIRSPQGRGTLYIHALVVGDPDQLRAEIKEGFERLILRISEVMER